MIAISKRISFLSPLREGLWAIEGGRMMARVIAGGCFFLFSAGTCFSQTDHVYKSFEAAEKNPKAVYHLKVTFKKLDSIPHSIGKMVNLETLELNNNHLVSLPDEICDLPNLKELNLFRNKLKSLPSNIGNLKKLEKLVVSSNELTTLPVSIGSLSNLKQFSAKDNKLKFLPQEFSQLKKLEQVFLSYNFLDSLPNRIGNLYYLEQLYLEHNQLTKLPQSANNFANMKYFYLGKNLFSEMPVAICYMTQLQELDISYCGALGVLPDCLKNIVMLDRLYLDSNVSLPYSPSLFHNPNLQVIIK